MPDHEPHSLRRAVGGFLASVFRCYSEVLFVNGSVVFGFLVFACTMLKWQIGVAGIVAVIAAYVFARLIHLDQEFFQPGFYTYNPLLIGLSIGAHLRLAPLTIAFIVVAAILTLLATIVLVHVFRRYFDLPVLSTPFAVTSVFITLASLRYSNLVESTPADTGLLEWDLHLNEALFGLSDFCESLGAVFFLPHELVGLGIAVLLAWRSRILLVLAVGGFVTGVMTRALLLGSVTQALHETNQHGNFNFMLIAMAIGGVFLTPSLTSYAIAIISCAAASIVYDAVQVFGAQFSVPVYTIPFNVVTLGTVYALVLTGYPGMARRIGVNPEETLENDVVSRLRFPGEVRTLALPFYGEWTVWQESEDDWTHQGIWRFAYDFVITDDDGRTHDGAGLDLTDYHCFRKPVVSPIAGRVVTVVSRKPDNPVGEVDETDNWGNHVVLHDERGWYVEISHFAQDSIRVSPGDWVEVGTVLGLCGNSGYSPQPHLHVHVQATEWVGSATLPFSFVNYVDTATDRIHANDKPGKGDRITPAPPFDPQLDAMTGLLLGDELTYEVRRAGSVVDTRTFAVRMSPDGTLCLECVTTSARLFFGRHEGTFHVYHVEGADPVLRLMRMALPRLPLAYRKGLSWSDFVPVGHVAPARHRALANLLGSFVPEAAVATTTSVFRDPFTIETTIRSTLLGLERVARVHLDAERGPAAVRIGDLELRRVGFRSSLQVADYTGSD